MARLDAEELGDAEALHRVSSGKRKADEAEQASKCDLGNAALQASAKIAAADAAKTHADPECPMQVRWREDLSEKPI